MVLQVVIDILRGFIFTQRDHQGEEALVADDLDGFKPDEALVFKPQLIKEGAY